jgi:hypothetical protein
MKILHLSHHIGCFKDQEYVLNKLGHEVTSLKVLELGETLTVINPIESFRMSSPLARVVWSEVKDYLNSFDVVLTSDTAPISRIILENIEEFSSKLVIWICNRYNYELFGDTEWTKLFDKANDFPNVKIVPYTLFEKIWANANGIRTDNWEVITPLGKWAANSNPVKKDNDVWVGMYYNDNKFMNLKQTLIDMGVNAQGGDGERYADINELKRHYAMITLPDAPSKLICFELIHLGIPALLPAKPLMKQLKNTEGYGIPLAPAQFDDNIIDVLEWYDPELEDCRYYYNSFKEIPKLITNIKHSQDVIQENCEYHSRRLEEKVLSQWKNIYDNL